MVQTGPKIQFGGLNAGLFIVVYQLLTELEVKKEPIKPISKGIVIDVASLI